MRPSLDNKTLIITGGFGNLGIAVALEAHQRGANLVLVDYAPGSTDERLENLGDRLLMLGNVDLTDMEQAKGAIDQASQQFGKVDALLNIAGGFRWELFGEADLDNWDLLYNLNVKTAITASKAALPALLSSRGSIVCISAGPALKGALGMGPYAASKAAVSRFVESLSEEVKDQGVRVNAVMPSVIDTPLNREDMPEADFAAWVTPQALARVILFLASDEADAVTGAVIPVFNRA
tara:strand:+ start:11946 stop:12653 length:708 start_codon:yes stop_codon:yes gene_type:complete